MKKKLIAIISGGAITIGLVFGAILISCLLVLDFFGTDEQYEEDTSGVIITDDYIQNNYKYASKYKAILNQNLPQGKGYVPLVRIVYFYQFNNSLSFEELYNDNLNSTTKKRKKISEVCEQNKYMSLPACDHSNLVNSNQNDVEQAKPFNSPLNIGNLKVSSFFMEQRYINGKFDVHNAWDFPNPDHTPVYSVCDGIVTKVNFKYQSNTTDTSGSRGNEIFIQCKVGNENSYQVIYGHLFPNSQKVSVGDQVSHWTQIAEVGTTGYSTGSHLHYEVKVNNKLVDGMSLIDFNKVKS